MALVGMYQLWYTPSVSESGDQTPVLSVRFFATASGNEEEVKVMGQKHIGSDFDDFLRGEGLLEEAEAVAAKRVIAFQIAREMERAHISHSELARRMNTSRSSVERLLDPTNTSVTLVTLERAASAVGKRLKVQLTT